MDDVKKTRRGKMARHGVRICVFLIVFLLLLSGATELLRDKTGDDRILLSKDLEKETEWDVIFAGSSEIDRAVFPMTLWGDYGFTSWNNAQAGEVVPATYYTCKNIIRRCRPKVLVLGVSTGYLNEKYGNLSWMHESLDPISLKERMPAIMDLVPQENRWEFMFPLYMYHDRWSKLEVKDFSESETLKRGCTVVFNVAEDIAGMDAGELTKDAAPPADVVLEYLDKIVELCDETGTELLMVSIPSFVFPDVQSIDPTHDMTQDILIANWLTGYADEKGVGYINFFTLIDDLGFDWFKHMSNYSHMNYWGGSLITDYLGQYLTEHYDLPDRREDPDYQNWNEDLEEYEAFVGERLLAYQQTVTESNTPVFILPRLPSMTMITKEEYGDWVANEGVWLSKLNGVDVNNATELTLDAGADSVELRGWMADFWNSAPVRELYLQVGETILKCEYGSERADVVERFGNERLRNCGFSITFPVSLLGEDIREVSFIGVSADGQYLYEPVTYKIEVE